MLYREATIADIPQIMIVRFAVTENTLSNPALVTNADCEEFLTQRGKGWVAELDGKIAGFAIADLVDNNIWALFVHPAYAVQGIGKTLHSIMLNWYFSQTTQTVWLGTAPNTRAEQFYRLQGWVDKGLRPNGEIRFEFSYADFVGKK
jgi:GNAT superfamily N-acetyltransferase